MITVSSEPLQTSSKRVPVPQLLNNSGVSTEFFFQSFRNNTTYGVVSAGFIPHADYEDVGVGHCYSLSMFSLR